MVMFGFLPIPWLGKLGHPVSANDDHMPKILGAANVDLGLVILHVAQANKTHINILPPKFFVVLACVK